MRNFSNNQKLDEAINIIGLVNEVYDQLIEAPKTKLGLRQDVTVDLADRERFPESEHSTDLFDAKRIPAGSEKVVDPVQFFRLYKRGKLTEKDFCACINVNRNSARLYFGESELDAMSTERPRAPYLIVRRIKGVAIDLLVALQRISRGVQDPEFFAAQSKAA